MLEKYWIENSYHMNLLMIKDCESCEAATLLDPNLFSEDGTISLSSATVSPDGNHRLLVYFHDYQQI